MYSSALDVATADRLANLALACVHREYPSKIAHSLNSDKDVQPPRELTPAFYGCYDWHSSVHGHWMLARLARTYPNAPLAARAKQALRQSLTVENLEVEAKYLNGEGRASFERPYGLAWLLQLLAELAGVERPGCPPMGDRAQAVRRCRGRPPRRVAEEADLSGAERRALEHSLWIGACFGLCPANAELAVEGAGGNQSEAVLWEGPSVPVCLRAVR